MSLAGLMTYTVDVYRRTTTTEDEYGDPVSTFTLVLTSPAWMEQTDAREQVVGRDRVIGDWLCILPVGTVLEPYDRVVHDGRTFEVIGVPALAGAPEADKRHVEALLRHVEG